MKIEFEVHNVAPSEENKSVELEGEQVSARIPCVEVELVTTKGEHGSLTLRYRGAAAEEAKRVFVPGAVLTWDIEVPAAEAKAA